MTDFWTDPLETNVMENTPPDEKPDYGMRECPKCFGEGGFPIAGYSINPYTGIRVINPQSERWERCGACGGTGKSKL